jgi:flagellin-like hook-associated protein FlgL
VEAREDGGRVRIETTKKGAEILETDLVLANAVTGAVADPPGTDPWDTLGILGFYRDPATGISEPQQPAQVQGTVDHAGGIVIVAGVNDSFNIDLGPSASIDGTNPASVTVTLAPGAYADASALAAEINTQINNDATLKNAVLAEVRTVGPQEFVDIVTVNEGSRVQASDLLLTDDTPGTLAALGLAGATIPGGGTSAGQGQIDQPDNIINTMIQIRDELYGYAARSSRLTDLLDDNEQGLGVFPGAEIVIHSDGTSSSFIVQRFTTMDDFADRIEEKLGFQLEVDVLRDGKIQIFNPTTTVINDVKIEAFDRQGNHITPFEDKMAGLSGKLVYRSEVRSDTVYEDERFQEMTQRIGDMDNGMETVLSVLSIIGARQQRLTMTKDQNDRIEVNIAELQSENDTVDMAETIMRLQEQESVLRATLGVGAQVIPPSLFDFLR